MAVGSTHENVPVTHGQPTITDFCSDSSEPAAESPAVCKIQFTARGTSKALRPTVRLAASAANTAQPVGQSAADCVDNGAAVGPRLPSTAWSPASQSIAAAVGRAAAERAIA